MSTPLEGIRIVEMGQLIAMPHATKLLADMGAQVIRLESRHRLEYRSGSLYLNDGSGAFWNRAANFYEQNRNKQGLTLELDLPEGLELLKELVSVSDVFAENFTPRVIKNFGLEYEDLRRIRPDIIMVSSTGYGYTGPWSNYGATGPATEAASGLAHMTGYREGPPMMSEIPYADYVAAEYTTFAIMAALLHRMHTGEGQFIDVSQAQTVSSNMPEPFLDFAVNARTEPRMGNEDPALAPHGCYPCRGDDRWIAIAVSDDIQWQALCRVLGKPQWITDPRFSDGLLRWHYRAELDEMVCDCTRAWDAHELMHALQGAGVSAGAVLDSESLLFDPHLRSRGFFEVASHHPSTDMPPLPYAGRPWKLSDSPALPPRSAPIMGEHNRTVLCELLGRSEDELAALESNGVIGYAPVEPTPVRSLDPEEQVRQGRMQRYEANFKERVSEEFGTLSEE